MTTSMLRNARCLAALAVLPLGGCLGPLVEQTITTPIPHVEGGGLKVTARNGSIDVTQAPGREVTIVAKLKMQSEQRIKDSQVLVERGTDNTLAIRLRPPDDAWRTREGCSFEVSIPSASSVSLASSNGALTLTGLAGSAVLETSNGRIAVENHNGPVDVRTSNGTIRVQGVPGPLKARSSNGSIAASVTGPGPVEIRTSNGAISLDITRAFAGAIEVRTSNGSLSMPDSGATVEKTGRNERRVKFDSDGPGSTVRTSNGSVTIRVVP